MPMYMKVGSLVGPVSSGPHRGWSEVTTFVFVGDPQIMPPGVEEPHLTKKYDRVSSSLLDKVSGGWRFDTILVDIVAGSSDRTLTRYQFDDVRIKTYELVFRHDTVTLEYAHLTKIDYEGALARLLPSRPRLQPFIGPLPN